MNSVKLFSFQILSRKFILINLTFLIFGNQAGYSQAPVGRGGYSIPAPKFYAEQSNNQDYSLKNQKKLVLDPALKANDLSYQFRTYYEPKNKFAIFNNTTQLCYGGTVRVDGYFVRNALTLRDDRSDDAFDQFRQRSEFAILARNNIDNPEKRSLVEAKVSFGNVMLWRSNQPASYSSGVIESQDRVHWPVRLNLQESWINLSIDRLAQNAQTNYLNLKMGYFPFFVGRGISLGDWYNGGANAYGFTKTGVQMYVPKFSPGLLLSGTVYKDWIDYDFYYSPAVTEEIAGNVLSAPYQGDVNYSSANDRHIFAGRAKTSYQFYDNSKTYFEPYFVHYNSPRNSVNVPSGSPLKFLTFGGMLDHKSGGFEFNIEAARQFGRQSVAGRVHKGKPDINKFIDAKTKTFVAKGAIPTNATPGTTLTNGADGVNLLRISDKNDPATNPVDSSGTVQDPNTFTGTLYHRHPDSIEEWYRRTGGGEQDHFFEYHHPYEIELAGRMVTADMRYTFDDYPLQLSASAGYFAGDKFPYNDQIDKFMNDDSITTKPTSSPLEQRSKQFLPLRDYHYTGLWALPMIMFNAGVVPRPYDFALGDKVAYNEFDSATNLKYLAFGMTISPIDDLEKFSMMFNTCFYWVDNDLVKWDKNAQLPAGAQLFEDYKFNSSTPLAETTQTVGSQIPRTYNKLSGWISNQEASNFLGWEINTIINYQISSNLDLAIRAGVFFPGQLYHDLEGQPNINTARETINVTSAGVIQQINSHQGLGTKTAYGANIRLRYVF